MQWRLLKFYSSSGVIFAHPSIKIWCLSYDCVLCSVKFVTYLSHAYKKHYVVSYRDFHIYMVNLINLCLWRIFLKIDGFIAGRALAQCRLFFLPSLLRTCCFVGLWTL